MIAPRRGAHVGAKRTAQIRWRATDLDHDRLQTRIDYSIDGGKHFTPIFIGPDRRSVAMPSELLSGSRRARVRIAVDDGFNRTVAVSAPFSAAGRPPRARIITPLTRSRFTAAETIALAGDAYDDRRKRLRPSSLRWFDGKHLLARGRRVIVNGLPPGLRRIRLVARDRLGRRGIATVRVRIVAVRPRFLVLEAPRHLRPGAHSLALRISANVRALLTVRGVRYRVDRRPRRIQVRVDPGRRPLRLPLRLRAGRLGTVVILTIRR